MLGQVRNQESMTGRAVLWFESIYWASLRLWRQRPAIVLMELLAGKYPGRPTPWPTTLHDLVI